MGSKPCFSLELLGILFLSLFAFSMANEHVRTIDWVITETPYTRLCSTKKMMTVNGLFPGPPLYVYRGEKVIVNVRNQAIWNITLHWHGVRQPRNPWSDGPEYVTQCPIKPGANFSYEIIFSTEEGTLWYHAHSDWSRATVHGPIIIYPKIGTTYPFPKFDADHPIVLASWFKGDVMEIIQTALANGGEPNNSDAFTINGQPGDFYPCSKRETFKLNVHRGKTYLLHIVNAAMNEILFFSIAKHKLTVVGADGSYTKPLTRKIISITPGQTLDALLRATKRPARYYMAARAYSSGFNVSFDNTTATAIVDYHGAAAASSTAPFFPHLPYYNDTTAALNFSGSLRSLADESHPTTVPTTITTEIVSTVSVNTFPCPAGAPNRTCQGPNVTRLAASMNNISFANPSIDILQAYYNHIKGVFGVRFPSFPPFVFNFTADNLPMSLETPRRGRQVKILEYNSTVEMVFQGTNLVAGIDHPMHLHGHSFFVVGLGLGNFDKDKDPLKYNLVDPPLLNTVMVPKNGWTTVRFTANNPGVWFMHCHLDRHLTWGMETVFIVKNGKHRNQTLLPPPPDMPPC